MRVKLGEAALSFAAGLLHCREYLGQDRGRVEELICGSVWRGGLEIGGLVVRRLSD